MDLIVVDSELTLSPPQLQEADELFSLVDKNRTHLREFMGWVDFSTCVEDTKNYIQSNSDAWRTRKALHFSIWKEGVLVGAIGCSKIDPMNRLAEVGYWLDKESQGKGIMTRSLKALIDFVFNELNFHRLEIRCATHNLRSQKIPERLGFRYEGLLKEAIHHYGEFFDAKLYGLTKPR